MEQSKSLYMLKAAAAYLKNGGQVLNVPTTVTAAIAVLNPEFLEGGHCPTCRRYFTDKSQLEFIESEGECGDCEHVRGDMEREFVLDHEPREEE